MNIKCARVLYSVKCILLEIFPIFRFWQHNMHSSRCYFRFAVFKFDRTSLQPYPFTTKQIIITTSWRVFFRFWWHNTCSSKCYFRFAVFKFDRTSLQPYPFTTKQIIITTSGLAFANFLLNILQYFLSQEYLS